MKWVICGLAAPLLMAQDTTTKQSDSWTKKHFKPSLEFRTWLESREGVAFGLQPEISTLLVRTRVGLVYHANDFFRIGGMMQDARAPWYGRPAPGTARDETDLHEAYLEFGRVNGHGWSGLLGRRRVQVGSANLIGVPEWSNAGRTYDAARLTWSNEYAHLDFLLVSSVKFQPDSFDKPVLGDRVWGMYHSFPKLLPKANTEFFLLRHDQNASGGFVGPGSLGTTSFGVRLAGALPGKFAYDGEILGQGGHIGLRSHRAAGWNVAVTRKQIFLPSIAWTIESKYASGSDPRAPRSATFDQLYPANHDRFGHADVIGWRNIVNYRFIHQQTFGKHTTMRVTFTGNWLANRFDSMYDLAGRPLARSPSGDAGTRIGDELAIYTVHRIGHFQFGLGFAQWWLGGFVERTTPAVSPRYLYIHHSFNY